MDTGSCQASCIDRVYMCWQIGIDIGVSISIGADVYTNSDTLGGTVFSAVSYTHLTLPTICSV